MHYLCISMPLAVRPYLNRKIDTDSLTRATILACAVYVKVRLVLMTLHKCWLGRCENLPFVLSHPGVQSYMLRWHWINLQSCMSAYYCTSHELLLQACAGERSQYSRVMMPWKKTKELEKFYKHKAIHWLGCANCKRTWLSPEKATQKSHAKKSQVQKRSLPSSDCTSISMLSDVLLLERVTMREFSMPTLLAIASISRCFLERVWLSRAFWERKTLLHNLQKPSSKPFSFESCNTLAVSILFRNTCSICLYISLAY